MEFTPSSWYHLPFLDDIIKLHKYPSFQIIRAKIEGLIKKKKTLEAKIKSILLMQFIKDCFTFIISQV